jgi:hypothetical protein
MSLIEQWRDRKRGGMGPARPPRLWKLLLTLAIVVYIIMRLNGII